MDKFPNTRHSIVERIRLQDPELRRLAFGDLVEGYWKPVYKHLRLTWRQEPSMAEDLAQGFFAEAFERGWLERFDPTRARFRTFVRLCVDRYAMNMRQADLRLKRGGGVAVVPLNFAAAEREIAGGAPAVADPEAAFHQEFVRALFERSLAMLRAEYEREGRLVFFEVFERYDLAREDGLRYGTLASELGLTTTQVTNRLAHVRRRFREITLTHLRTLCATEEEYRREARDLFGLEVT